MGIAHDLVLVGIAHDLKEKKNESLIKSLKPKSAQNSHPFPSDSMYSEKSILAKRLDFVLSCWEVISRPLECLGW